MSLVRKNGQGKSTIFVVDDEPMLLDLAATILRPLGYEVWTFRDPELALKEFSRLLPDVVITDYAMGRMTGMDLIRECRRLNPGQKIVMVSGTVDENIFAEARVQPDQFITKPYQLQEFIDSVRALAAA